MASILWWRSWHGAPTDNKWLVIANHAKTKPGIVSAVFWELCDYASQNDPRGSIFGFDIETYSIFSGFSQDEIASVISAMENKELIKDGMLVNWTKRQPVREDDSRERVNKWRENKRNVTHGNASSSADIDKDKEEDKDKDKELPPQIFIDSDLVGYQSVFEKDTGIGSYRIDQAFEVWSKMKKDGVTPADMHIGIQNLLHAPTEYTIVRPQSVQNAAYTAKQKRMYDEQKQVKKPTEKLSVDEIMAADAAAKARIIC